MNRRALLLALPTALFAGAAVARLGPGVTQRFTVYGHITHQDGSPAAGVRVLVIVAAGRMASVIHTDADGWYRRVLLVGDKDLGKVFEVKAAGKTVQVKVEFDPKDTTTERGARVDFTVPPKG